jgi:hypothetical protein
MNKVVSLQAELGNSIKFYIDYLNSMIFLQLDLIYSVRK